MYWDILYNTDSDKVPYNDSFKHSTWLVMMKNRLEIAKKLLADEGAIVIQCDDNEQAYLKVLCDEIFERDNFVNTICVKMSELKGFKMKNVDKKFPKLKEYLLIYCRDKQSFRINPTLGEKGNIDKYLKYYNKRIVNIDEPIEKWKFERVDKDFDKIKHANEMIYPVTRDTEIKLDIEDGHFGSRINKDGVKEVYIREDGKNKTVLFLNNYLESTVGDIWDDISTININKESPISLKNGQKPEKLLERIIEALSKPGDIILDAYFGTGTTGAVAMKLNRRFIGIEQLQKHYEIAIKRLKGVVDGDNTILSKKEKWEGGNSFKYLQLKDNNQEYIEKIQKANKEQIINVWKEIKENAFITHRLDIKLFDENIEEFKKLQLKEQKEILLKILDKNMLYVNYSDIDDEEYNVGENDKKFNKQFYNN